ncbi:nicotinate-nucleotide adenylyltransferase [Idiomarina xiamenensis]|uniref:Probable nicotinate-nucleotide adenylyltransferase n=1 Tax=Idiomarina xiamenensis 10-D-4 TaxID=740709 RepID=K2KJN7_9GAMM|nr:nicotinate-nucleotide adenylyltransferase [Idiomarina xiamenensis]EKE82804.1 nicotinic acid mononucleotide adenylyltransferase [Idiomarina xiamenensis 10-D-4]
MKSSDIPLRAIFGGTFDPIHQGHTGALLSLAAQLPISQIHLLPSAIPPHRAQPQASAEQRFAMTQLAAQQDPRLLADDWELQQQRPSYSSVTLAQFGQRFAGQSLLFVMGMDAFLGLPSWHQWQQLFVHAHIVVMARPGYHLSDAEPTLQQCLQQRRCSAAQLQQQPAGGIYLADTQLIDISATALRQALRQQQGHSQKLLYPAVFDYIRAHHLYQ